MLVIPKRWGRLVLLLLGFGACAPDAPPGGTPADCRYQAPEPVFGEKLTGVSGHHFEREGMSATETFVLDQQLEVVLYQSGCDYIQQEFIFTWAGGPRGNSARFWVREAADQFERLAHLGAAYVSFKALSDALRQHEASIQLEKAFELQAGLAITISPLSYRSPKQLRVVLRQE
ncbi:MAG: hypothetical protein GVY26_06040 [Bacteroidetes bacterium]|jgi:hypothetical protein|nr:hypothetical protein [Bacteroidota bacterium]